MDPSRLLRAELDSLREPVAILTAGVFVWANRAFLERVGVGDFNELAPIPLLDMVSRTHKDALKKHLAQAARTPRTAERPATARIAMFSQRGEYFEADCSSHQLFFEGEECVQVTLTMRSDGTLWGAIRGLPWALYMSVAFLLLFSTLPGILLQQLNINNTPRVYHPPDEPALIIDEAIREKFPSDQVVVMMFEGVALFSDGFLEAFDHLGEALEANPLIDDVLSVTRQDHISGTEDGFAVEPLIDVTLLDETHPRERPEIVLADRFARRLLASEDGSALAMVIIPFKTENSLERLKLLNEINAKVDEARLRGYVSAVAGEVVADVAQLEEMLHNNMVFIPLTTVVGLLLIWWLFHRPLAVVVAGISVGVVSSTTIALYVMFGRPFTLLSSMTPPLLTALTIAALVHLFNALHYASQRGQVGNARVRSALNEIRTPTRYSVLTTSLGLASLGLSPIPAIADFGLIAAVGLGVIYLVVIWAVPQIFSRWDHSAWPSQRGGLRWMDSAVRTLARTGTRFPAWVLAIVTGVFLIGMPQLRNIEVETSLQEFFSPNHPFRRSTDRIDRHLVGTTPLDVVFTAPETDGMLDPERLTLIRAFQRWAEALPEVDKSVSPADFVEEMNWGFNEEDPEFRVIPDSQELITQYLFIYDGEDLIDFLDRDYQVARVSLNLNVHKANEINKVLEQIRGYLREQEPFEMTWEIGGGGRLFADTEELLVMGQVYSLGGALVTIFLLMVILWRSFGQAVLTMLPNLAPILMIFISLGLFGIWLDFATALIASVAVGIAVDDTIHIFHGFRERLKKGCHPTTALMRTYAKAGRAVVTTTLILTLQFMTLVTSQFTPFTKFGLLTALGLVAALLFDLLVLPAILMIVYGPKGKGKAVQASA